MSELFRGMDQTALRAAYDNVAAVEDAAERMLGFQTRSAALYETVPCRRDVAYGPRPRQRFDWLPCGRPDAPIFVFIHGGYWQARSKEDFAFVASGPLACGFNVVLAEYTLAPEASMTEIVGEIEALLATLGEDRDGLGTRGPICLAGHSAGGQLSAHFRAHEALMHAMPISALVDLEPIAMSWLNDKLQLTPQEIEAYSPIRHIGHGVPMTISVGTAELPELIRHSEEYAAACRQAGEQVEFVPLPGCNHFTILEDLARPDGVQMRALVRAMKR
ncbi:alpha/beta hydrolase [Paraburkholderia sp. FT54]|uniref:alpha/beta hydrolase n=1 Tax=Paraburkholderia sp. FT54 TaxID=3074437 RepID=UPI00287795C1|nr:alpha/beta hydrolase [Paraburkholderia sp. FT54]WNC94188.1 alpha/beta hydrolase [Paraburkholderia sp. FT54]